MIFSPLKDGPALPLARHCLYFTSRRLVRGEKIWQTVLLNPFTASLLWPPECGGKRSGTT
jgi:hypothetical protein